MSQESSEESQRTTETFAIQDGSSSNGSSHRASYEGVPRDFDRVAPRRDLGDDLEAQLENLRGSFEDRAAELGRRTTKVREALDVAGRIRAQPMAAMALGAAGGAVAALVKPTLGRAITGLLSAIVLHTGRQLAWRVAERAFYDLLYPADPVDLASERQAIMNTPLHGERL